jgi:arylsulfatase A-like enzyme
LLRAPELPATAVLARQPLLRVQLDLFRALTDFDRDGYSSLLGGGDCRPLDADINPGRREIVGNGIDDNCTGGDGAKRATAATDFRPPPLPTTPSPVNVVLVTVDTLRPDRMSAYGYERDTTPNIARWARGATRFRSAYTSGGWTTLAIPSLQHGRYPRRLSWDHVVATTKRRVLPFPPDEPLGEGEKIRVRFLLPLRDPSPTLANLLAARGMATRAVVDGGFTHLLARNLGFGQGFDDFVAVDREPGPHGDAGTRRLAAAAIEKRPKDRPFFLWVHFFGPHAPSTSHPEVPDFGDSVGDRYDHEIAFVDLQFGKLLEAIEEVAERPTVVVLASDHGERFYSSKSRGHGRDAAEDSLRIPLIVQASAMAPGDRDELVSLVDVMPTLLALTETPIPAWLDGIDLTRPAASNNRVIFSDSFARNKRGRGYRYDRVVALSGPHKLVHDRVSGVLELNLRSDREYPAKDWAEEVPAVHLRSALSRYLESTGGAPRVLERKPVHAPAPSASGSAPAGPGR